MLGLAALNAADAPGTERNVTHSMMSSGKPVPLRAFGPAARHRRFEEAAPQPTGGGTAPRTPVVNVDQSRFKETARAESAHSAAGGVMAGCCPASNAMHLLVPMLVAVPVPVIIQSPYVFAGSRLIVFRARLRRQCAFAVSISVDLLCYRQPPWKPLNPMRYPTSPAL